MGQRRSGARAVTRFNTALGGLSLLGGLFLLVPLVGLLTDGERLTANVTMSESTSLKSAILAVCAGVGLALAAYGFFALAKRRSVALFERNIILALSAGVLLLVLEGLARLSIANGWAPFDNEKLYSSAACSEDYWKLRAARIDLRIGEERHHPILGWTASRTGDDPDRLRVAPEADPRPKILFYGDSFMAGISEQHGTIPRMVQPHFPEFQMLNYGVGGYGIDQIWLRYKITGLRYPAATVVFGALTQDLGRSLLKIRDYPKPYFEERAGRGLVLAGVPIGSEIPDWLGTHQLTIRSYAVAALTTAAKLVWYGFDATNIRCNEERSRLLNAGILTMATDHAAALEHPLVGLVFVTAREMYRDSWQHRFLVGYFRERNIPAVDMKDVILRDARARDRSIRDYFLANDGHPSALGNQVVAEAVARLIAEGDLLPAGKGE